jgi:L-iditol 2-dehydrogenase
VKAALLESVGKLTITEVERPALADPDQVLVQVKAVGVCGSEIHAFKGTHPFRKPPSVLGHEVTGDVVRVGTAVRDFVPGDRVFVDPQWTCGECRWCRTGRHNLCPTKQVLGTVQWSGGLGEYVVAPERSLYPLPEHVSYIEGTTIEPLSVAVHMIEHVGVGVDESVVVLGTGAIGMMVTAMASVKGASPIIAVDLQAHCLDMAQQSLGATHGLLAGEGSLADRILDITQGKPVDVILLTVGVPSLVDEALAIVATEGRIMFVALFDQPVQFEPNVLIDKHLTFLGSAMYNARDIQTAVDLVSSGKVQAGAMVTHVLPLAEAQRGFDLAATKQDGAIKVVLEF